MRRNHTARFVGLTGLIGVASLTAALAFTTSDEIVYEVNNRLDGVEAAIDSCSSDPSNETVYYVHTRLDRADLVAEDGCRNQTLDCTLRAAINLANTTPGKKHRIQLNADTFTLTIANATLYEDENNGKTGDLDINVAKCLTIVGFGHFWPTVIDAGGESGIRDRVLDVHRGSTVVLKGLTIQGGWIQGFGAGIRNAGDLTGRDVNVRHNTTVGAYNSAGGIFNVGTGASNGRASLILEHSVVAQNTAGLIPPNTIHPSTAGGGLDNYSGDAILRFSSVVYNRAGSYGGGVIVDSADATLVVENSTVAENEAAYGGGLSNRGRLDIINSTISSNLARFCSGTAIEHNSGQPVSFVSSTIARNHGDMHCGRGGSQPLAAVYVNGGTAEFQNSIIDQGTEGCAGSAAARFQSGGYNIDSGRSCQLNAIGDRSDIDPRLGPFTGNGGPTFTHALLAGSPAVDAIPGPLGNGSPQTDQRRAPRFCVPFGCEARNIGSYEDAGMLVRQLIPEAVLRGSLPRTIKVEGEGFGPLTVVWFDGSLRQTVVKSSTELEFYPHVPYRPLRDTSTNRVAKVRWTEQAIAPINPLPGVHWVSVVKVGDSLYSNGQPFYVY